MQAPKQEIFILNWEISFLTEKLQRFTNVYDKIDLATLDGLSRLIDTVDALLSKTSFSHQWSPDEEAEDAQILKGYDLHHSINCKNCGRSVRIKRFTLLNHMKKHALDKNNTSLDTTLSDDDQELADALRDVQLDEKDDTNEELYQSEYDIDAILAHIHGTSETTAVENSKEESPDGLAKSSSDEADDEPRPTTVVSAKNPTSKPGKPKTTKAMKKSVDLKSKSKKMPKQKEPKRGNHVPVRAKIGEYFTVGSLPDVRIELGKKTRQFIVDVLPKTRFEVHASRRREVTDSLAHRHIVQSLESTFRKHYPGATVYLFGSRVTGLGNECSDLDIYLDLENNYDGTQRYSKETLKWFVQFSEQALQHTGQWSRLEAVTSARTPILRAWNTKYKIDCDISFTHGLSHCNTRLIQYLFGLQPVCCYVALYAKEWSHSFNIPFLNTYTLILLTVFYFQKHNLLPSIYDLQKDSEEPYIVSHWQADFKKKSLDELGIPRIPEDEIQNHLVDFFSFYGSQFCFETRVVCPFLGWAPQKEDFDPLDCEIPMEMETLQRYYDRLDFTTAHPIYDLLSYVKPMVVQDPLELNHNVAKGLSPADVDRFRKYCAHTAALLDEVLHEKS
ncbi:terminal uridylyltransferase Tailor [Aedes albopictus]|uniref:Poly(A) RNA polymerase mitochondrial-like central palm domain-containing protein n=1 Tax=Aedes albopictus TaxID=7160 RepID=A0ABM1ZMG8_AEDAL|nr:terminal uridylyltransferase Tailor-like [Aedes albopictus]